MTYESKTDWKYEDVVSEQDLNRIEGGIVETQTKVDAHVNRKDNPHGVTPTQIGAETTTGAQAKVDAHANRKDNPHAVTADQIGAIAKGANNSSVSMYTAVLQPIDTRSINLIYTNGLLTKVDEKDGNAIVKTTELTYTNGKLSSVKETAGGKTITETLNYNADGTLAGVTKAVS
ncbi:hypothetical protein [Tumebacillus lipolyticus]|uniref:YD repeat-containing protein n=1 Tax=Tumebacillus lipolyticus TaxID=1280370 RepID=A0ABW4ZXA7_9BACL